MSDWPKARREAFVQLTLAFDLAGFEDEGAKLAAVETLTATCFEAGAAGVEERVEVDREGDVLALEHAVELIVYTPIEAVGEIEHAVLELGAVVVGPPEAVEEVDWSKSWQAGFDAIEVSPALLIRPSFVSVEPKAGQREIVIDPGQAFGTGGHASTRLVLETIRALSDGFDRAPRVLDVGTGTGVLALAAIALGAERVVGFDLDPLATREAQGFARANGMADFFDIFTGGIEALAAAPFDLVLANLLKREMLPIVGALAEATTQQGHLVLSGLLDIERDEVEAALSPFGLACQGEQSALDANGDRWICLLMARG